MGGQARKEKNENLRSAFRIGVMRMLMSFVWKLTADG
jgi:hypothetical protein